MTAILAALGAFRFSLDSAAYQSLSRTAQYRWAAQERLGREPASQFLGPGEETLTLDGVLHPHHRGGLGQIERMRALAGQGRPLLLVDGTGRIHGNWVILAVEETGAALLPDGTPRRIAFRLSLRRYGDDR